MKSENIKSTIKSFISKTADIDYDTPLSDLLEDSLDMVRLCLEIESAFDIPEIDIDDFNKNLNTINKISKFIIDYNSKSSGI